MATGKTNSRWIRVTMDDSTPTARDISAGVSSISSFGLTYNTSDVTGYSDGIINFTLGHPTAEIDISGPITNTASTGAHIVFSGIVGNQANTYTLLVEVGIRAAPATGDPTFSGEYYCSDYKMNGDGTYTAHLVPAGSTAPAWSTKA